MISMHAELITVKVSKKSMEAEDTASFELVDPGGAALPTFTAGSHIDVHINEDIIRQYSLSNDPAENHRYLLGVQKKLKAPVAPSPCTSRCRREILYK